jgi:PhoPQ-activated pathogenicity-related protein
MLILSQILKAMLKRSRFLISRLAALAACALVLSGSRVAASSSRTALDEYVAKPDPAFKFELVRTIPGDGYTVYVLEMVSQTWRNEKEVDRTVWKHWVTVTKPDKVSGSTALLFIGGGNNTSGAPAKVDRMLSSIATATNTVVAELRMVPNQPLVFPGDGRKRREDEIIAYTWDKFMRTGDANWPLRLPMTKAAVRAMDAVTAFAASAACGNIKVERFVVAGASKRGWTTWTTAAVDKRVVAFIPLVIDLLNMEKSMIHHYRAYGFWAPAIRDYVDMHIMDWVGRPEFKALMKIEEPYEYRQRYTMPKYIVNAAGDQFFLPDSSQFYFNNLPGEKYLRYVPNTDHSLKNSDVAETMTAFYQSVLDGTPRPKFTWKMEKDGTIRVRTATQPSEVKLWQATNPKARDFRLDTIGPAYKSTVLTAASGAYLAKVAPPPAGFTAYFIELTYPGRGKHNFKFTTGVRVTPDRYPSPAPKPKPI